MEDLKEGNSKSNNPDLLALLKVLYRKKWIIILAIVLGGSLSWIYLRYAIPVYETKATVRIDLNEENILRQSQLPNLNQNESDTYAEIDILSSRELISQVVDSLNLTEEYGEIGRVRSSVLYGISPFKVIIDSNRFKDYGAEFQFQINNLKYFTIKFNGNLTQELKFDEWVIIQGNKFKIQKPKQDLFLASKSRNFYFKVFHKEYVVSRFIARLTIVPVRRTIFSLSMKDEVPARASRFINKLISVYLDQELNFRKRASNQTLAFIETLTKDLLDSLKRSERELRKFENKNHISFITEDKGLRLSNLKEYQKSQSDNELREIVLKNLEKYLKDLPVNPGSNEIRFAPTISGLLNDALADRINDLNSTLIDRALNLTNNNLNSPVIRRNTENIIQLTRLISDAISDSRKSIESNREYLNKRLDLIQDDLSKFPSLERDLATIERNYKLNEKIYASLQERRIEEELRKSAITSKSKYIEMASIPTIPISPNYALIRYGGVLSGLLIGLSLIIIQELSRNTYRNRVEIETNSFLPILSEIVQSNRIYKGFTVEMIAEPKSAVAESFRNLRSNIQYVLNKNKSYIITVTSTISGEGKSYVSLNLAGSFTLMKKKILLVDLDLRKPRLNDVFNLSLEPGLSNFLSGNAKKFDIIKSTGYLNLDFVPAGSIPPNPAELLSTSEAVEFFESMKTKYDYIIVDTSPIGLVTDSSTIAKMSDIVLYLLRANYSKRNSLLNIERLVEDQGLKSLYIILNSVKNYDQGYGYRDGYGQGYYYDNAKLRVKDRIINFFTT